MRVDSNSCGTVQQNDLQQCKDPQNNKNRSSHLVLCALIFKFFFKKIIDNAFCA